jgi:hypothetical protein
MTGVIVRSSANVQAGAVTRLSAILHGVWILAFVALLPWRPADDPQRSPGRRPGGHRLAAGQPQARHATCSKRYGVLPAADLGRAPSSRSSPPTC